MDRKLSRREFSKLLLTGAAGIALETMSPALPVYAAPKRIVIIGGGFGGTTAAKYLRKLDPSLSITLVEPKTLFYTCPVSNLVVAGIKEMQDIAQNYTILKNRYHVKVITDTATAIDPVAGTVALKHGKVLHYDRLVVSPGIDFIWNAIPGYSQRVAEERMPHAFEAGVQTLLLRKQLLDLPNGGTVLICPPANPFRCPPAPYERASLIAMYLKRYKPKSKVIILDSKEKFAKQGLFTLGWERLYPGMIEWRAASAGGKLEKADAGAMTVTTEFGDETGGIVNIIPPQKAARIAVEAGLIDSSGWCPVNPVTFESTMHPGIHVIGDACRAGEMPKSGFAASSQGKIASAAIVALLRGKAPVEPFLVNTCYSFVGAEYAISVVGAYRIREGVITDTNSAAGLTPLDATDEQLRQEAAFAWSWYKNCTRDIWG